MRVKMQEELFRLWMARKKKRKKKRGDIENSELKASVWHTLIITAIYKKSFLQWRQLNLSLLAKQDYLGVSTFSQFLLQLI